jgi:hypothetical protein
MTTDPDTPPTDPPDDDADLIAYLDGELDDDRAQAVERRLTTDPAARTRADEYQKTFDLLDFLPTPQPSAAFASRTLTRLNPAVESPKTAAVGTPSTRFGWLGWAAAAVAAGLVGYGGAAAVRSKPAPPTADDFKLMAKLPYYIGVDDVGFLRELATADLFDDPPAQPLERPPLPLTDDDRDRLIAQFRTLPTDRQQQLRTLHQQLSDAALENREAVLNTLEAYAVWLDRLPPADRRRVLEAAPEKRVDAVREVRESAWRAALPLKQRQRLQGVSGVEERVELSQAYRGQETARRHEWELAQRQWKELSGKDKVPWPFDDPTLVQAVDRYILSAFGVDPSRLPLPVRDRKWELPAECRLTRDEVLELRLRRDDTRDGYWLSYGALLLRLAEAHPTLPRFPDPAAVVVRPDQMPKGYVFAREGTPRGKAVIGKWPDFALDARPLKGEPSPKPLGPCKPAEFSAAVRGFIEQTLADPDRKRLGRLEGRWPEYPQELARIARERNLAVPEVTLPGEPKKWEQYYRLPSGKK